MKRRSVRDVWLLRSVERQRVHLIGTHALSLPTLGHNTRDQRQGYRKKFWHEVGEGRVFVKYNLVFLSLPHRLPAPAPGLLGLILLLCCADRPEGTNQAYDAQIHLQKLSQERINSLLRLKVHVVDSQLSLACHWHSADSTQFYPVTRNENQVLLT